MMVSITKARKFYESIRRWLPSGVADAGAGGVTGGAIWPVGSIFISVVSTNPATLLGYGTWTAFGAGRFLVGRDAGDADFNVAQETGGAKTHTLTTAEMPSHTHVQDAHSHTFSFTTGVGLGLLAGGAAAGTTATSSATAVNQSTGGGGAHNNLPPYIVCYFWRRVS